MRKLLVTCECGQKMQVPRSAIGKMGMCPTCGRTTRISTSNTTPMTERRRGTGAARRVTWDSGGAQPSEEAKQRFGQAVDYYYAQRYAEALAIFDALLKDFPGNPDIEHGRQQCMRAMQRPQLGPPSQGPRLLTHGELDYDTVKRVVLDKLLNGSTDAAQLQAAEIACKYFGIAEQARAQASENAAANESASEDAEAEAPTNGENAADGEPAEADEYSERIRRFPSEDARK